MENNGQNWEINTLELEHWNWKVMMDYLNHFILQNNGFHIFGIHAYSVIYGIYVEILISAKKKTTARKICLFQSNASYIIRSMVESK